MIKVGDKLPDATFRVVTAEGPTPRTTSEVFKGKRVVLVGMPGAFTATCSKNHLPGYVEKAQAIRAKGVDAIVVTAVNDHWVMNAWGKASGGEGKILFLADGNGEFAKAIGLNYDASERGMGGVRSKRYAMLVEDGVVKVLNIETETGKAEVTSADNLMKSL
ncbi:MAG: peroxiredoxin [Xanthobacteraceae bacterium]|nr:peroxiredoxin [Xanthobacteraceae bacterium]